MPCGDGQIEGSKESQIVLYLSSRGLRIQLCDYLPQRQTATGLVEKGQNRLLPFGQVSSYPLGRHIAAGAKAHGHATTCILDLGLGQTGRRSQLCHLDRTPSPLLNDAAAVKHVCDQGIPG